jgi:uncharacterized membrane protein YkvA (DUF1232 family)
LIEESMAERKKKATRTRASRARTRRKRTKATPPAHLPLQSRLEAEFSHAINSAKVYVKSPERLRDLVTQVTQKVVSLPQETFKGTLIYIQAMLRLIRAYYRGEYRAVPATTLLIIVAALIYLLNPLDLLPDWIPGLGFLDDAFILTLAIRRTREAIDQFLAWESSNA